jgi:hypothetical protein
MALTAAPGGIWETIAAEAAGESPLWAAALRPPDERELLAVFSPLAEERFVLGLETIYEGYLMHYGRPRLFAADDRDTRVLLGDYLYAHGLVRVAEHREVAVVADLAELISLCAQVRAEAGEDAADEDGALWAASLALLGNADGRLADARSALRDSADPAPLAALARETAGADAVDEAMSLHRARLG